MASPQASSLTVGVSTPSSALPGNSGDEATSNQIEGEFPNPTGEASPAQPSIVEFIESRLSSSTDLYAEAMRELERYLFTRVLETTGGNQSRAAEILGITRGKVRDRIAAFNIQLDRTVTVGR